MKIILPLAGLAMVIAGTASLMVGHETAVAPEAPKTASATVTNDRPPTPSTGQSRSSAMPEEDLERIAEYEQWLEDHFLLLQGMPMLEQQTALWKKREELFGEEASRIWGERESPMHDNQEALQAELKRLDKAHEITPEETAHQLKTTIEQLYNNDMARQLIGPDVMARTLFSLDAVQHHLKDLPNDARQARINKLRKQMGYPEDVISRLEQQDQQRNERWEKGEAYMSEREQLTRQYAGEPPEQALQDLREEHFGRSAKTIALEERDGFFRFERERRFGVN